LPILTRVPTRLVVRLAVAVLVAAAVGLGVPGAAQATTCADAHGVSVVVDFHELGGGVRTACDTGGAGETADAQLRDVGHALTYVQRQPGFICRIDGRPANDACVNTPPADAYWSLWWSDGTSGKWSYASQGASSLKVPDGGYVGMSWQGRGAKSPPGAPPTAHRDQPTSGPTTHPPSSHPSTSTSPGQAPSPASSASSSSAPGDPGASSSPGAGPASGHRADGGDGKHHDPTPSNGGGPGTGQGPDRTEGAGPSGDVSSGSPADTGGSASDGLPGWVAPLAIAVLFVGAGTIVLARRGSSGGG
jgi:hypothetical protein